MKLNNLKGKLVSLSMKVNRNKVVVVGETKNAIKVCNEYRMRGDPDWKPVYQLIQKKDILSIRTHKKKR